MGRQQNITEMATLKFNWNGDFDGKDGVSMHLRFNGEEIDPVPYGDGCEVDIPLTQSNMYIKVETSEDDGTDRSTHFERNYQLDPTQDYECRLSGQMGKSSGLAIQMSKPGESVGEDDPKCYSRNSYIFGQSFLFPVYGAIMAFRAPFNRMASLWGAGCGMALATWLSYYAMKHHAVITFGIRKWELLEYKPFSMLDWIINFLIGGVASLWGVLQLLLETLFK